MAAIAQWKSSLQQSALFAFGNRNLGCRFRPTSEPATWRCSAMRAPQSTNLYRRLIRARRERRALTRGSYRPMKAIGNLLLFARETKTERMLVALNLGDDPIPVSFSLGDAERPYSRFVFGRSRPRAIKERRSICVATKALFPSWKAQPSCRERHIKPLRSRSRRLVPRTGRPQSEVRVAAPLALASSLFRRNVISRRSCNDHIEYLSAPLGNGSDE